MSFIYGDLYSDAHKSKEDSDATLIYMHPLVEADIRTAEET